MWSEISPPVSTTCSGFSGVFRATVLKDCMFFASYEFFNLQSGLHVDTKLSRDSLTLNELITCKMRIINPSSCLQNRIKHFHRKYKISDLS